MSARTFVLVAVSFFVAGIAIGRAHKQPSAGKVSVGDTVTVTRPVGTVTGANGSGVAQPVTESTTLVAVKNRGEVGDLSGPVWYLTIGDSSFAMSEMPDR